jgi:xanthine dehydrogenase YagS FAD-binding subunit
MLALACDHSQYNARMPTRYSRPADWASLDILSHGNIAYLAGGTEIMPLLRASIIEPDAVIDLNLLLSSRIELRAQRLSIGALARLSDVASHELIQQHAPAIRDAILASASGQIRNMASIGGNLLQRTRCSYFRSDSLPCNKRQRGSGCPARNGESRHTAIFGSSDHCVAVHASDVAVALSALDAAVHLRAADGTRRTVPLQTFYTLPGDDPHVENILAPGEVLVDIEVPIASTGSMSKYFKVRDRASFDFSLVSVAVAVLLSGARIERIAIALGGVAPAPWRLHEIEARLHGALLTSAAVESAFAGFDREAQPLGANAFKIELARALATRAILSFRERTTGQ